MIVWAAQTRVHYMFLVSRCRCNFLVHTFAALRKEVERDFRDSRGARWFKAAPEASPRWSNRNM